LIVYSNNPTSDNKLLNVIHYSFIMNFVPLFWKSICCSTWYF